jgi:pimeloyl-ACP methyl ester carboxylesterase
MSAVPSDEVFDVPAASPLHLVRGSAPGLFWYLTEPTRCALDVGEFVATRSMLRGAPAGDGHPVLVFPGLGAADSSTVMLRRFLSGLGYEVHRWGLGRNIGPTRKAVDGMHALVKKVSDSYGGPVSIVGWSLGGIFAREMARDHPHRVRQVITMGSPYNMSDPVQSRAMPAFSLFSRLHIPREEFPPPESTRPPIPVPATSIYSKTDGIVSWESCVEEPGHRRENVQVSSSHLGYGFNATVLWVVADRLAQAEGTWAPFAAPPGMARLYPRAA